MRKNYDRDFKDIEYFIDHVTNIDARLDVLKKLGYKIGLDIVNEKTDVVKRVLVGKKGELRIQVTPKDKRLPIAKCVILD